MLVLYRCTRSCSVVTQEYHNTLCANDESIGVCLYAINAYHKGKNLHWGNTRIHTYDPYSCLCAQYYLQQALQHVYMYTQHVCMHTQHVCMQKCRHTACRYAHRACMHAHTQHACMYAQIMILTANTTHVQWQLS